MPDDQGFPTPSREEEREEEKREWFKNGASILPLLLLHSPLSSLPVSLKRNSGFFPPSSAKCIELFLPLAISRSHPSSSSSFFPCSLDSDWFLMLQSGEERSTGRERDLINSHSIDNWMKPIFTFTSALQSERQHCLLMDEMEGADDFQPR